MNGGFSTVSWPMAMMRSARSTGDRPLAHLGVDIGNLHAAHEIRQAVGEKRPARRCAQHQQRTLGFQDQLGRALERGGAGDRDLDRVRLDERNVRHSFGRDVFRQFQMNRPRPFLLRQAKGVAHDRGYGRRADDLARHLGQRCHRRNDVHDLKPGLLAVHDALLPGDHHHRHRAQQRIGGARGQIERPWTEGREADARPAGQPPVRGRHEGGCLFMPGQDELDARAAQRFDDVERLFARHPEDPFDALVLQGGDEQIGAFHGLRP